VSKREEEKEGTADIDQKKASGLRARPEGRATTVLSEIMKGKKKGEGVYRSSLLSQEIWKGKERKPEFNRRAWERKGRGKKEGRLSFLWKGEKKREGRRSITKYQPGREEELERFAQESETGRKKVAGNIVIQEKGKGGDTICQLITSSGGGESSQIELLPTERGGMKGHVSVVNPKLRWKKRKKGRGGKLIL